MKLKSAALIVILMVMLCFVKTSSALTEPMWIVGRVSTPVTEQRYNMVLYYEFNFTLMDSNVSMPFGSSVVAIMPTTMMQTPMQNAIYNFTGRIVDVQTNDIPAGFFIVDQVNTQTQVDWGDAVFQFISIVSGVVRLITDEISQLLYTYLGIQVPSFVWTIIIIGLALYFVIKHWKAIGLILILVLVFLAVSGVANILRLVWMAV